MGTRFYKSLSQIIYYGRRYLIYGSAVGLLRKGGKGGDRQDGVRSCGKRRGGGWEGGGSGIGVFMELFRSVRKWHIDYPQSNAVRRTVPPSPYSVLKLQILGTVVGRSVPHGHG